MGPKILLVDDETDNRLFFKSALESHGYRVRVACGAEEAAALARQSRPDLVLSDVAMPEGSGLDLCRRLKSDPKTAAVPVILMSGAHREDRDQAEGLELGADDYLPKPFTTRLMLAKVGRALKRLAPTEDGKTALETAGLSLDTAARTAKAGRRRLTLTRKEFDLLATFLKKAGRVLSTAYLLEAVWGYDPADYNDPHTVESHLSSLRRKLGPKTAKRIVCLPGVGYRFDPPAQA